MSKRIRCTPEAKERAVRMLLEHQDEHPPQWQAICSIAPKIACTGETLRCWPNLAERDQGLRAGSTTSERERLKKFALEYWDFRRANEILRKASAYFAQAEAGVEPSVGSVGNSHNDAFVETVIGLYKTCVIRRRGPWRNLDAVEFATF